jgi:hypothetical protein
MHGKNDLKNSKALGSNTHKKRQMDLIHRLGILGLNGDVNC